MTPIQLAEQLITFIRAGATPFHVINNIEIQLQQHNFIKLEESESWQLTPQKGYYVVRGGTIVAFYVPKDFSNQPYHIWGAHTDSPLLKLRGKNSVKEIESGEFWGVEIYGSPILNTWLDRPLDINGKIYLNDHSGSPKEIFWDATCQAVIPNAAIHLNREVNKGVKINQETQLQAFLPFDLIQEIMTSSGNDSKDLLSMDLFLNDSSPPVLIGNQNSETNFIQSPKLDNLAMCHAGLNGLIESTDSPSVFPMLVLFNHEEIGSKSNEGAASIFLTHLLDRISLSLKEETENKWKRQAHSVVISADMAHAYHPGFDSFYGKNHRSYLHQGIVLKRDANLHYMNDSTVLTSMIQRLKEINIPYQEYFQHNEIPCGSTIGPHLSAHLGFKTLDLGTSILAMHSIRETGSIQDHFSIVSLAKNFLKERLF